MHLDMFRLQLSTSGKGHESAGKEMTKAAINISYRCAPPGYSSQPSTPRPITCPAPCLHPPLVRFPHTDVPCSASFHRSSRRPPSMAIAFIKGQTTARSERMQIKKTQQSNRPHQTPTTVLCSRPAAIYLRQEIETQYFCLLFNNDNSSFCKDQSLLFSVGINNS